MTGPVAQPLPQPPRSDAGEAERLTPPQPAPPAARSPTPPPHPGVNPPPPLAETEACRRSPPQNNTRCSPDTSLAAKAAETWEPLATVPAAYPHAGTRTHPGRGVNTSSTRTRAQSHEGADAASEAAGEGGGGGGAPGAGVCLTYLSAPLGVLIFPNPWHSPILCIQQDADVIITLFATPFHQRVAGAQKWREIVSRN